ncbi:ras-related GTP-binding protein-like protein C [Viridothelium virens]|uniref:GTP-binding protein n=1 Tax=Viridothelium virens TaxID=1048519 RepID=A0A6A6GXC9_VIRVR|nr:ras-related GTP-binding protein-like protein C [Viridothelium virens]
MEGERPDPPDVPSAAHLMLTRYISDLQDADTPANPIQPKWHTGRLPNSKQGDGKPRLLLMGQRRSGKSSISSVVFHKMPPSETLYLETTTRITKDQMHSFMDFQVWDFPGHLDYFDPAFDVDNIFGEIGALVWVIDAQDEYLDAINRLNTTILNLQQHYPSINVEVFVHKVDGLSEDYKSDTFRDIIQRVQDELSDNGYENAPVSFYQTSIYDHSIFEAFSKVIQKLIPQLPTLESLLNSLCSTCRIEKAYLFDVLSKIYIATDTSPTDIGSYEICSDYIDVIVDISEIYGWDRSNPDAQKTGDSSAQDVSGDSGNDDAESLITMEKKGSNYLYLREINKYLALICIMSEDSPTEKKALVDYNVSIFQEALQKVFQR